MPKPNRNPIFLTAIWLFSAGCDRLWFALDKSVPSWDVADYLTASLTYWRALQNPQWFSGEWWANFWMLSPKIPPLTFILAAPFQNIFNPSADSATLVHLLFSAILLASVYGLGKKLFNSQVGLWAAGLCVLFPGLYRYRLQFLLDYPLTAMVTLSFYCLTLWKFADIKNRPTNNTSSSPSPQSLFWAIAFGVTFGLAIMVKQTALFFLLVPLLWVGVGAARRRWGRLAQLIAALSISTAIFYPWARTNWLLMFTAGKRATVDSAIAEGDPALHTLDAWTYYWKLLPYHVSWPLLLVPIVGLLIHLIYSRRQVIAFFQHRKRQNLSLPDDDTDTKLQQEASNQPKQSLNHFFSPLSKGGWGGFFLTDSSKWLAVYLIGGYLISSLNINKDFRYTLPLLPVLSIFLAYGLTCYPRRWGKRVRWITASLAIVLMFLNLWLVAGDFGKTIAGRLSPGGDRYAYLGKQWSHEEVIAEIIETQPYLQSTLGVLPSTPEINQHNLNYYGALQNLQVYGRQVGTKLEQVPRDARSLSWFVTKTNEQGSVKRIKKAQGAIVSYIENSPEFQLHRTWVLPDNSNLNLYHRQWQDVEVNLRQKGSDSLHSAVGLDYAVVENPVPPGKPIPITYKWSGVWEELKSGLVLLTYRQTDGKNARFFHDHAIGNGTLHSIPERFSPADKSEESFEVIERMGMLAPGNLPPGSYVLEATYLNRKTGESYPMKISPAVKLEIQPEAIASSAPELDLVTQLRGLATELPKGVAPALDELESGSAQGRAQKIEGLEVIFEEVARINQYDPVQDYTVVADKVLEYRLRQEPDNLEWAYNLALAKVLQQDGKGAIAALKRVVELDKNNPFARAYLAFVYLYDWQPKAAKVALKPALEMNPNLPEIRGLNGVAALMQGNLIEAWRDLPALFEIE